MTTTAPWALEALDSLLSDAVRRMGVSHWVADPIGNPIQFTGGVPDPESLPVEQLLEATRVVLAREPVPALEYGGAQGFAGLRELIATRVAAEPGISMTAANISLVSGGAHALHNVFETFVNAGDAVFVDAPAWGGAIRTLKALGPAIYGLPWDNEGIIIEQAAEIIERAAREGNPPKLIYTIPTFQNPMGVTMTADRRSALIDLAARHRILILEDDPYGELRFGGSAVPSIYALAGGEGVLRAGSFSKVIATGLRVGWIQGHKEYVNATLRMRFDNGTSPFVSRIIAAFVESGALEPHIVRLREVYRSKCDAMLSALAETCTGKLEWTTPEGGFFLWLTLPEQVSLQKLLQCCNEEEVAVIGGTGFFAGGGGERNVRLAYSNVAEPQIVEGIRRFARALDRARG